MLQLGRLRHNKELKTLKPELVEGNRPFHFFDNIFADDIEDLFLNYESYLANIPENERWNVFYTVAHHKKGKRSKKDKSFERQAIIPFDFDGIGDDKPEDYLEVAKTFFGFEPICIGSGNGVHLLVRLQDQFTNESYVKDHKRKYKQWVIELTAAFENAGLKGQGDTTCWDSSRILRMPFTKNIKVKENEAKELYLHDAGEAKLLNPDVVRHKHNFDIEEIEVPGESKKTMGKGTFGIPDGAEILKSCDFFKWLKDKPEEVHEPHAYAALSILGRMPDQSLTESLWQNFSSPSINSKDLPTFTEQAVEVSGPRTCEGINDVWGACKNCPKYQKITSPIQLKGEKFIATETMGFTTQKVSGNRIVYVRQYEDLRLQFEKDFSYKYVDELKRFYVFRNGIYKHITDARVETYAQTKFKPTVTKSFETREFVNHCKKYNNVDTSFVHANPSGYINFLNGCLNIKSRELVPHTPKLPFKYKLDYEYDPQATCPTWDIFLSNIMLGREHLKDFIEEYLGYCVSGMDYVYPEIFIMDGGGANGKSTLCNVFSSVVGPENSAAVSIADIAVNRFAPAGLTNKLVNISEEEPEKCFRNNMSTIKKLTGNSEITAEKKGEHAYTFLNRAKLIITYNEVPMLFDKSAGARRRFKIIPFDLDVLAVGNEDKRIENIAEKLKAERPGILNKALFALTRLKERGGFAEIKESNRKFKDMLISSDPTFEFLETCCEVEKNEAVYMTNAALYNAFTDEFGEKGVMHQQSKNKFLDKARKWVSGKTKCEVSRDTWRGGGRAVPYVKLKFAEKKAIF